jgi:septal ring factor EnvC (AmiA/AmiB activator)
VLAEEVEPSGFEALAGLSLAAATPASKRARETETKGTGQDAKRREKIDRLERELAEAREAVRSAETKLRAAQRDAERARRRVDDAEKRLERA